MAVKKKATVTVALFEGRHELPANEGAICSFFDFDSFRAIRTPLWEKCLETLRNGGEVKLYVTGLTPALSEFLKEVMKIATSYYIQFESAYYDPNEPEPDPLGRLVLLQYNKEKNEYEEQIFLESHSPRVKEE